MWNRVTDYLGREARSVSNKSGVVICRAGLARTIVSPCIAFSDRCNSGDGAEPRFIPASAGFRDNAVKPYIPRVCGDFRRLLAGECEPDEFRFQQLSSLPQKRKGAVVIAATHAYSQSVLTESNQWRQHEIQFARGDDVSGIGHEQAVVVTNQVAPGSHFTEFQQAISPGHRGENPFLHAPCARDYAPGIYLGSQRQVTADPPTALKKRCAHDLFGNEPGCAVSFGGVQVVPRFQIFTTQLSLARVARPPGGSSFCG